MGDSSSVTQLLLLLI